MSPNGSGSTHRHSAGPREIVVAGGFNGSEPKPNLSDIQAAWLARRLRLSREIARLMAEQCFPQREVRP